MSFGTALRRKELLGELWLQQKKQNRLQAHWCSWRNSGCQRYNCFDFPFLAANMDFPVIKTPWLAFVGITKIDFSNFATVGYLFVDMMVLISGFLLFCRWCAALFSAKRCQVGKLRAQTHCANRAELLFCRAAAFLCLRTSDRGICNNGGRLKGSFCPPDLYPNALGQHIYCNSAGCCAVDGCNRGLVLCSFPFVAEFIKGPRNKNRQSFTPAYGIFFIFAVLT